MNVKRTSWHTQVYLWWYARKYPHSPLYEGEPAHAVHSVNLCPYMRTVVIYAPVRFLFTDWFSKWLPICIIPALMLIVPKLAGYASYDLKVLLWVLDGIFVGVVVFVFLLFVANLYGERPGNVFDRFGVAVSTAWKKTETERRLIAGYVRSGHDRICPEITIEG